MRLVWKCNYCCNTEDDKEKMEKHESSCSFDPARKNCWTCDNKDNYYDYEFCKVKNPNFHKDTDDMKCEDWTNSEIRIKKLKKLKNKINES